MEEYLSSLSRTVSLVFPMIKDRELLRDYWKRNNDEIAIAVRSGKRRRYLTVGDPSLYSTWIYVHRELDKDYRDID